MELGILIGFRVLAMPPDSLSLRFAQKCARAAGRRHGRITKGGGEQWERRSSGEGTACLSLIILIPLILESPKELANMDKAALLE